MNCFLKHVSCSSLNSHPFFCDCICDNRQLTSAGLACTLIGEMDLVTRFSQSMKDIIVDVLLIHVNSYNGMLQ
jgi:hypothetical protein